MPASREQCFWAQNRIEAYIDNELRGSELERFDRHITSCDWCRKELAIARTIAGELRKLPPLRCPESVLERASNQAAVASRAPHSARFLSARARFRRFLNPGPLTATAVLLIVIVAASFFMLRHDRTPVGKTVSLSPASNEIVVPGAITEAEAETVIDDVALAFSYVDKYSLRTREVERQGSILDRVMKSVYKTVIESMSPFPIEK